VVFIVEPILFLCNILFYILLHVCSATVRLLILRLILVRLKEVLALKMDGLYGDPNAAVDSNDMTYAYLRTPLVQAAGHAGSHFLTDKIRLSSAPSMRLIPVASHKNQNLCVSCWLPDVRQSWQIWAGLLWRTLTGSLCSCSRCARHWSWHRWVPWLEQTG